MAKYVKCPRCDLNYILEGEQYCDVCKAELKLGPQLMYADDEDKAEEKLCPKCKQVYIFIDEDMCENCRELNSYDDIEPETDDEKWRDFLDEDEKEEISNSGDKEEDMISLSKIAEEELDEFEDEEEEEDEEYPSDDDDDDFDNIEINEADFEEEDEDEDDENNDDDDLF